MADFGPILDTHQHFWLKERGDYHWMSASVPKMYRDYMPEELRPHLKATGVTKTILVQAAQTVAETDFLLDLAARTDFVAGVVGWLPMDAEDFPAQLDRYRKNPLFVGIRPMLQDLDDDAWILKPRVTDNYRYLAEIDFPVDWLVYPRHLPYVVKLLEKVPNIRGVFDHLAKPDIKGKVLDPWRELMACAAQFSSTHCKLSGMITEADHDAWTVDDIRPYCDHVFECFGQDRLMFGSDWPPCNLAGDYERVIATLKELLASRLDQAGWRKILYQNGARFYGLSDC